jgi:prophage regulatory protein
MAIEVVSPKEAERITGLGRTTMFEKWSKKSPRYDPSFPQPFKVSQRKNGLFRSELEEWVMKKASASRSDAGN